MDSTFVQWNIITKMHLTKPLRWVKFTTYKLNYQVNFDVSDTPLN